MLENDLLQITVEDKGAELAHITYIKTGQELLWSADPAVWNRHAPLLFPYCGGLYNNQLVVNGVAYPAAKHGFARDTVFNCVRADAKTLVYRLEANDETRRLYPFSFVLEVAYTLQNNSVVQTVTVHNTAGPNGQMLPFNVGFHPGFVLPLTPGQKTEDYEVFFEEPESPIVIETPDGYVSGSTRKLFAGKQTISLTGSIFANDSICLSGLRSGHIFLREKQNPQRNIRLKTGAFPYVLLWGPPSGPLPFMCIEPWHGLPDGPDAHAEFADKPGITLLAPDEHFVTTLEMEFNL
ncbi:aldose 1-epimerase family protein [Ruminococcaceae bacterium OttesenSCG-928-A16]|nr:aldose 1-epimerase family protein [Ruminococcaceae bacterium OttesenSCG-928-A16]